MLEILNQLNDEELDFTVTVTDTQGVTGTYEFLDIVSYDGKEYAVVAPEDEEGVVEIFLILEKDGKEAYEGNLSDDIRETVFEIFKIKNEDEFDFE